MLCDFFSLLSFSINFIQAANSKRMVVYKDSRGLNLKNKQALFNALRPDPQNSKKKTKIVVEPSTADSLDQEDEEGEEAFTGIAQPTDFEALTEAMEADVNPHRVLHS